MVDHLSFSSITSYLSCARAWKFKYLEKAPTKTSSALAFGSAFHETIQTYLTKPDTELLPLWSEAWGKQAERVTLDESESPEALQNEGIRILSHPKVVYEISTIPRNGVCEYKITLNVPGVPVPIIGYIDYIDQDNGLSDFKTSKASWPEDKAKNSLQPLFYLAAMRQMGERVDLKFRHYVFVKTKEPKVQVLDTTYQPAQFLFLFSLIQNVWKSIDAGAHHENPDSWLCNSTYCDFWKLCRGKYE
jgi:hypothetical protein